MIITLRNQARYLKNLFLKSRKYIYLKKNFHFGIKKITVLSNCCVGGLIYKNLDIEYQSPTISNNIMPQDFIKFVIHLDQYAGCHISKYTPKIDNIDGLPVNFPCGKLKDIIIMFVHDRTFESGKEKWDRRINKIIYDNIVVILFVEKKYINNDLLTSFREIKYPKLLLSDDPSIKNEKDCGFILIPSGKKWFDKRNIYFEYIEQYKFRKFFLKFIKTHKVR